MLIGADIQPRHNLGMDRKIATVQLSDIAGESLDAIAAETRLNKKLILERILRWVGSQDEVVRAAVLGTLPPSVAPDVARLVLERMSTSSQKTVKKAAG